MLLRPNPGTSLAKANGERIQPSSNRHFQGKSKKIVHDGFQTPGKKERLAGAKERWILQQAEQVRSNVAALFLRF